MFIGKKVRRSRIKFVQIQNIQGEDIYLEKKGNVIEERKGGNGFLKNRKVLGEYSLSQGGFGDGSVWEGG